MKRRLVLVSLNLVFLLLVFAVGAQVNMYGMENRNESSKEPYNYGLTDGESAVWYRGNCENYDVTIRYDDSGKPSFSDIGSNMIMKGSSWSAKMKDDKWEVDSTAVKFFTISSFKIKNGQLIGILSKGSQIHGLYSEKTSLLKSISQSQENTSNNNEMLGKVSHGLNKTMVLTSLGGAKVLLTLPSLRLSVKGGMDLGGAYDLGGIRKEIEGNR